MARSRCVWPATFLFVVGWSLCADADAPGPELGRTIFEQGIGRDGREIGGRIHGSLDLRGTAVACISCHGADARGGGEAFVKAPDIRWHTLSKAFSPRRAGMTRPPYNRSTFSRAIHQGVASSGRSLDPAMPRFDLSQDETEALLSYLTQISEGAISEEVPTKVVLGLLPNAVAITFARELGDRLLSCPSTGTTTRFPPFEIIRYADPVDALEQIHARLTEGRISAVLAPYIAGWESHYFNRAKEWPVVTVLPVTPLDLPPHPNFTFAMPGLTSQVGALLDQALGNQSKAITLLTTASVRPLSDIVEFVKKELGQRHIHFNEVDLEHSDVIRPNTQLLVLTPLVQVKKRLQLLRHVAGLRAFVPAMFFDPDAAQQINGSISGMTWHIAYPYQPTDDHTGRWRSPAEVWAEAGCSLMATIGTGEGQDWVSRQSIKLNSGLTLMKTPDAAWQRKQVFVLKWVSPGTSK